MGEHPERLAAKAALVDAHDRYGAHDARVTDAVHHLHTVMGLHPLSRADELERDNLPHVATLIIYRGLPASGKTTQARAWVAEDPAHRARANRDDLRQMLHAGVYLGHETEGKVVEAEDALIRKLLAKGVSVACDDTNLAQKRARQLVEIARAAGAAVEVRDLTDVPVATCLRRDLDRGERSVGAEAISGMYQKYLRAATYPLPLPYPEARPAVEPYVAKPGTPKAVMVDLDGTLALHDGRSPYDETLVHTDLPNGPVVEALEVFYDDGYRVVFCSGRTDGCRDATERWLLERVGIPHEGVFMRASGDTRKDSVVKREIFDRSIRDVYDIRFVLDDRDQVVEMWRGLGLTVFQVAPGDF